MSYLQKFHSFTGNRYNGEIFKGDIPYGVVCSNYLLQHFPTLLREISDLLWDIGNDMYADFYKMYEVEELVSSDLHELVQFASYYNLIRSDYLEDSWGEYRINYHGLDALSELIEDLLKEVEEVNK